MSQHSAEVAGAEIMEAGQPVSEQQNVTGAAPLLNSALKAHQAGELDSAESLYRQSMNEEGDPRAWHLLGVLMVQQGHFQKALELLQQAVQRNPESAEVHRNLGEVYLQCGNHREALLSLERSVRLDPLQPDTWVAMSETLLQMGEATPSLDCLSQALQLNPNHCNARLLLGNSQKRIGEWDQAASNYRFVLKHDPNNIAATVNLSSILREQGQSAEAVALLRTILKRIPDSSVITCNLANALVDLGQFAEARSLYESALLQHPRPAKVLHNLFSIMKFTPEDREQLGQWERKICSRITSDEDASLLHFAMGKACDDLGDYEDAFGHYQRGNQLVPVEFDAVAHREQIEVLCRRWSKSFIEARQSWGVENDSPVFIVGMPRSGTTLIERIIASHPQVRGLGEREELGRQVAQLAESLGCGDDLDRTAELTTQADCHALANAYLKGGRLENGQIRFTDKMPTNFLLLGWIAVCFPNACIIHVHRDPRDVCLSCYFQNFTARMPFAFDLEHLVAYYRDYERLMRHWHQVLPGRILDVCYEEVTADPQTEGKRIIEHCGLDWSDDCLQETAPGLSIRTASSWQARQSIYTSSQQRWRNYRDQIGVLLSAFGDQPIPR